MVATSLTEEQVPRKLWIHIRDLGWQGVVGNTDEMLFSPESLTEFAKQSPKLQPLFAAIEEIAVATRTALGEERLAWLRCLPPTHTHDPLALVRASRETLWRAPASEATDAELESIYGSLGQPIVIYGHIHRSYIRSVSRMSNPEMSVPEIIVANAGSVSLSYDGDRRAAYFLLDESKPAIRRVEYDVDKEIKALSACRLPHADWITKILESGCPQMP